MLFIATHNQKTLGHLPSDSNFLRGRVQIMDGRRVFTGDFTMGGLKRGCLCRLGTPLVNNKIPDCQSPQTPIPSIWARGLEELDYDISHLIEML